MRLELATFLAALILAVPTGAAAETILQNDSLEMEFSGTSSAARLIDGEMYEAVFEIPADILPVEMLGVRVVMVQSNQAEDPSCPSPCLNACGRFGIEVWEEGSNAALTDNCPLLGANVRYKDPGTNLFTQDSVIDPATGTVLGFEVRGDATRGNATFKDLRFDAINQIQGVTINPVVLETSTIRVAIRAMDLQCTNGGMIGSGDHFPVLISDLDGVGRPLSNFVYGLPDVSGFPLCNSGVEQHYSWEDFGPAFMMSQPGDFIMRLILNYDPNNNMTPDMGMSMDMGGADMGSPATDMGASDLGAPPSDMDAPGQDIGFGTNGNAGLMITSVTPDEGDNASSTDIVIIGSGFLDGAEVLLNARKIGVTETQSGRISATVPDGLDPDEYDLVVTNPGGETAILMNGFTVTVADGGPDNKAAGSDGCCAQVPVASEETPAGLALVALLIGGALVRRRRRNL